MFNWIDRLVRGYCREAEIEAVDMYSKVAIYYLGIVALAFVAAFFNVVDLRGIVAIPMFLGIIVTPIFAFLPKIVFVAMGLGTLVQGLRDKDITQGSIDGIVFWYRLVLGTLLSFTIYMGVLFTWSFAWEPRWLIVCFTGALILVLAIVHFEMKTGVWQWVVVVVSVGMIVLAFWYTRPDDVFPVKEDTAASNGARSAPRGEVRVYHRETVTLQPGERTVVQLLGGQCITASDGSEDKLYSMEGSHNKKDWFNPSEGNWEWIGLTPTGQKPVEVTYEIRRRGECS